jgi:hypothetical protein
LKETTVVNKYHKVPYDIYIGRGSKWGNPFTHLEGTSAQWKVASRKEAILAFAQWLPTQPPLLRALPELKGQTLCCYCHPSPCHGDVYSILANALPDGKDGTIWSTAEIAMILSPYLEMVAQYEPKKVGNKKAK